MSDIRPLEKSITLAAGGLVWRKHNGGWEILIIYRHRYEDCTLPKGKIAAEDQDLPGTALREVKEETGFDARITGFAGCVCYEHQGKPKAVFFWHMLATGTSAFKESEEVQRCEWLPPDMAREKLSYRREKDLLGNFLNGPGI